MRTTIKIPPEEAWGPKREELIVAIRRSKFSDNMIRVVGKTYGLSRQVVIS